MQYPVWIQLYTTLKTAGLSPEFNSILTQAKSRSDQDIEFKNISLTYKLHEAHKFDKVRDLIYSCVEKFLHERFSDLTDKPVFQFLIQLNLVVSKFKRSEEIII